MSKMASKEKIADLYLYELKKMEKSMSYEKVNLTLLLDKKKIYYNQKILNDTLVLLEQLGLTRLLPDNFAGTSYDKKQKKIDNVKVFIPMYQLTEAGKDFVSHKQRLDLETVKKRAEIKSKWIERIIAALIAIAVFIIGNFIKERFITGTIQKNADNGIMKTR